MANNTQCRRVFDECCGIGPGNWVDYGDLDWQIAAKQHAARYEELIVGVEVRDEGLPNQVERYEVELKLNPK